MKLMTRQIRTSLKNCHSDMQLTLEDDINVPDSKPDIEHIIKIQGEIHVQETSAETDRAIIRGQLSFSLLYLSDVDFRQIHTMQGQIPFEESINLENANPDLEVHCHYDLEDCRSQSHQLAQDQRSCNPKSSLLPGRGTHTRHRYRHCFGRCSTGRDGRSHPAGRC